MQRSIKYFFHGNGMLMVIKTNVIKKPENRNIFAGNAF